MAHRRMLVMTMVPMLLVTCRPATAEWSSDPAVNLAVGDRSGPQVQPKLVARADGGFYVSWFDSSAGGYDVYLQRLDAAGNELWAHNGVLVADRSYSSTMDYGLAVDTGGNALLAFNDDRQPNEAVTVAKVSPDGDLLWGPGGVQVDSGTSFYGPPKVVGTADDAIVVAWSRDDEVVAQRLDGAGAAQWGAGVVFTVAAGSLYVGDLQPSDAGSVILSFVHWTGPFGSPIHLWAQKLAGADGASLWAADHVRVFDGGSLQFGNFPGFVTDGAGGAVFAWYSSTPSLQVRVQRVVANGTEAFAHNGVEVSTAATRLRVAPSAAFDAAAGEVFVFWTETSSNQSQDGVFGQRLNAAGERQWSDSGVEVVALGGNPQTDVTTLLVGGDPVVAWVEELSYGNQRVHAARLDEGGAFVWLPGVVDLGTAPTFHGRLEGAAGDAAFLAYAWERGDSTADGDVVAQNLNPDGTLGPGVLFADGFESGDTGGWDQTVP